MLANTMWLKRRQSPNGYSSTNIFRGGGYLCSHARRWHVNRRRAAGGEGMSRSWRIMPDVVRPRE